MKLRLSNATQSTHAHGANPMRRPWLRMESLLRTGQLILMLWLAYLGAQFGAKAVVQAGALLVDLLG